MKSAQRIPATAELRFVRDAALACGVWENDAEVLASGIVEADLRGIGTHGLMRLPWIVNGYRSGILNPQPRFAIVNHRAATALVDADNALGIISGQHGMQMAVERAREHGIGIVSHRNSNFTGALGYHSLAAVSAGMIGYFVNNAPAALPAWGGVEPKLGTNPFSVAIPAGNAHPIVVDMSSSVIARGTVRESATGDLPLPPGVAIDAQGRPTTDAHEAMLGMLLPFAGHKGFAIAVIGEVLSSLLSGARTSEQVPRDFLAENPHAMGNWQIGHTAIAIDISAFRDLDKFGTDCDAFIESMKASRPAADTVGVRMPGERGWLEREQRLSEGVPFSQPMLDSMRTISDELDIDALDQ